MGQQAGISSRLRRVTYSIASLGFFRTLADVTTLLLAYRPDRDRSFDRAFHTDTAGSVAAEHLGIADDAAREQAILYLPSPPRVTRWMLDHAGIDHHECSFIDLGCGKGRVLLLASEYPFRRVIGVEISPALSTIARENVARYRPSSRRCLDVVVEQSDATRFEFPETSLLIHLYHPFEPAVTHVVLSRLDESLAAKPRNVVVAYLLYADALNGVEAVFARFPRLRKVRYEESVLGQYNWLLYST